VLRELPRWNDERLLVGTETSDDAAVVQLSVSEALVLTTDFFTPIVDDPYDFGAIAAANALSDVYAMGGTPFVALNIAAYPTATLPLEGLAAILRGGADKAREAGVGIVGGHTIDDAEPKYGLSVVGRIHPAEVIRNVGARPGDRLFLTKALGTGVVSTAVKRGVAPAEVYAEAVRSMTTLNRAACDAMRAVGSHVHAATDVTGYGLLGHLHEMTDGSRVGAVIQANAVPMLLGARTLAAQGVIAGGSKANLALAETFTDFGPRVDEVTRTLLADAQTSGGLLMAVDAKGAFALADALKSKGTLAAEIGEIVTGAGRIEVRA
jgi:selenide,water dikinase